MISYYVAVMPAVASEVRKFAFLAYTLIVLLLTQTQQMAKLVTTIAVSVTQKAWHKGQVCK